MSTAAVVQTPRFTPFQMPGKKTFPPTSQQQAVLNAMNGLRRSINLVARAGCGKSSTLKMLTTFLIENSFLAGPYDKIAMMAFNKPIAGELTAWVGEQGFKAKVDSRTVHGFGISAWRKVAPNVIVDDKKVPSIFDMEYPAAPEGQPEPTYIKYREFVIDAVGYAKQRAFGVLGAIENHALWYDMIEHFSLDESLADGMDKGEEIDMNYAIELAINVYKVSLRECRVAIDYNDMILAPLYFKAKIWQYKFVMLDEAQDTNPARRALALAMLSPYGGRLIAVGDPSQAIYGFTGADGNAMDLIAEAVNAKTLPLNKTFRCAKSIVRLAQTWVPDIQAADSNPEGIVRSINLTKPSAEYTGPIFQDEVLKPTDAILCRNTKPLVEMAFSLLRRGIGCRIEGKDLAEGIVKLIRRFKVKNITTLQEKVGEYRNKMVLKYQAQGKDLEAGKVEDNCETILVVADAMLAAGQTTVESLIARFLGMFEDEVEGQPRPQVLTLSSVHKSKGREWDRVYILGRNKYMPNRWARKEWELQQEENLMYVAVTRAKQELVDIWVDDEVKSKT